MVRSFTLIAAVLGIALFLSPQTIAAEQKEKPTEEKLLGVWKVVKEGSVPVPASTTVTTEFMKSNKWMLTIKINEEKKITEGTWKLEGTRLSTTIKQDGKEKTDIVEITKLDDQSFEFKDATGKLVVMEKTKVEKNDK